MKQNSEQNTPAMQPAETANDLQTLITTVQGKLGLARKAGQLYAGFTAVSKAVATGETNFVLVAADLAPESRRKLFNLIKSQMRNSYQTLYVYGLFSAETLCASLDATRSIMALAKGGLGYSLQKELAAYCTAAAVAPIEVGTGSTSDKIDCTAEYLLFLPGKTAKRKRRYFAAENGEREKPAAGNYKRKREYRKPQEYQVQREYPQRREHKADTSYRSDRRERQDESDYKFADRKKSYKFERGKSTGRPDNKQKWGKSKFTAAKSGGQSYKRRKPNNRQQRSKMYEEGKD